MSPLEVIRRRAQIRRVLEQVFVHERTSEEDRVWIKTFLMKLSLIECGYPRTTKVGVMKAGRCAVIWIYEPTAAPLGKCPTITLDWNERFRPQL
jgi:hypothetical protein